MKKAKKILKRLFFIFLAVFILLIGAVVAIPYFFKDKLLTVLKEEINNSVNAKVDFADVNLSLLRSFPNLSLSLDDLRVDGVGLFEGVQLASIENIGVNLDLMSAIKGNVPIEIKSFHLKKPFVNVLVLKDGKANYDIAKEAATDTDAAQEVAPYQIKLQKYTIEAGKVVYDDRLGDVFLEILDLDHSGKGNFTQDIYDLDTKTEIKSLTANSGGISYLNKASTVLDAILNINMPDMKFTLKENDLRVNALQLIADGFLQMNDPEIYKMDLTFKAPQNNFKNLLSLIPNAYTKDYEGVKADGKFSLNGMAKGDYNMLTGDLPGFKVNLNIQDGSFQYPDLPMGIAGIETDIKVNSPSSNMDKMTVDVPVFKMKLGNNPFSAKFNLKTPISDPAVDTRIKGKIDLEDLVKAYPMEGMEDLKGLFTADVAAKTRMSVIEKEEYEKVDVDGKLQLNDFVYKEKEMPPVTIKDLQMDFSPQHVQIDNFDAKLGKSDLQAKGRVDNVLAWFSPEKIMKGQLTIRSSYFDANEWMTEESSEQSAVTSEGETETVTYGEEDIFDRFDFALDAKMDKVVYENYDISGLIAKGKLAPNALDLEDFQMKIGESDFKASGYLKNALNYVFKNETLLGELDFSSDYMNLNEFMVEETETTEEEYGVVLVPDRMDLALDARIGKVDYTNMSLNDLSGQVLVKDQEARLKNVKGKTLGGDILIEGGYNTQDAAKPMFDFKYDFQNMDFQKVFNTFNSFQQLVPVGEFLDGTFNTNLIMGGVLGQDLMPDYTTLTASGFLETLDAVLQNFKPLQAVGNNLNVSAFESGVKIQNSKNWFELKDGRVELQEFDYAHEDVAMKIGGSHGIDGGMDYLIKAKIPKKYFDQNPLGSAASSGVNWLQGEASKLGVNVSQGENVNVNVYLTGSMASPKVRLKFVGMDGETSVEDAAKAAVKEVAKDAVDSLKGAAQQEVDKLKTEGEEQVQKAVDDVKKKAEEKAAKALEEAKKKAEEEAAKKAEDELKKKAEEALGKDAEKGKKEVEDKLKKWNPFKDKKKKKEN